MVANWVVLLRGLPGEIAVTQSWLNANHIPTLVRNADLHGTMMELLVPADKLVQAKELLSVFRSSAVAEETEEHGSDWDE